MTIDGLTNGASSTKGSFRISSGGLCAYWAKNNGSTDPGKSACDNTANTGYNGLLFTLSGGNFYNAKLTSFTTGGRNAAVTAAVVIASKFTGSGSSETITQLANGTPQVCSSGSVMTNCNYILSTPVQVNSSNQIKLCSTPDIRNTVTNASYICSGNILNSDNDATDQSFYTISSMTFTYDVPTPLPIVGAGFAFGWSRRLRRRIGQSRVRTTAHTAG